MNQNQADSHPHETTEQRNRTDKSYSVNSTPIQNANKLHTWLQADQKLEKNNMANF